MNEKVDIAESRVEAVCKERLWAFRDKICVRYEGYLSGDRDALFRTRELRFYLSCLSEYSEPYLRKIHKPSHGSEYWAMVDSLFLEQPLTVWAGLRLQGRSGMETRGEVIAFCRKLAGVYGDHPFHGDNWTVMRHRDTKKTFAYVFERNDHTWISVKCDMGQRGSWRVAFPSVVPRFRLNKTYWNSIILDGSVSGKDIRRMATESYDLIKKE